MLVAVLAHERDNALVVSAAEERRRRPRRAICQISELLLGIGDGEDDDDMSCRARALEKGIKTVHFDRNGQKYHGRIAALADGAREAGLSF